MFGNSKPTNIRKEKLVKTIKIKNHDMLFSIENVSTADIDGNREVLDEVMIDNMIDGIVSSIVSNKTKYNPIPSKICIVNDQSQKDSADPASESPEKDKTVGEIIESYDPKYTLDDVILNKDVKDKIHVAISAVKHKAYLCDEWGLAEHYGGNRAIILNFYGKPGTGKTMAAEAVASALGKKFYHITSLVDDTTLCQLAGDYYYKHNGTRPPIVRIDSYNGDIVAIHLYEALYDHDATWDWYYVDRYTGETTNLMGESFNIFTD